MPKKRTELSDMDKRIIRLMAYTEPTDFCSYGERKDGEG